MKTIDIYCLEWFDKINGNSYFSALVVIDYKLPTEQTIKLPFQYGYGDHYISIAGSTLKELRLINNNDKHLSLSRYCRENNIILRTNKRTALKREALNLVK